MIAKHDDEYRFHLPTREKELLEQLVRLYPRIPSNYQPLSKAARLEQSSQQLLNEALAETRLQNKKAVQALFGNPKRLSRHEGGWCLTLSPGDLEWLLQVLNDIRVGSWIELGSPEKPLKVLNAKTAPHVWAMEMAGSFQMRFLEMLES